MSNKKFIFLFFIASFLVTVHSCRKAEVFPEEEYDERLSGGSQTVFDQSSSAFSNIFPGIAGYDEDAHELGDANFEITFVTSPAPIHEGLGPLYIGPSCASCHFADGRGRVPQLNEDALSLLFRVSEPGTEEHGGPKPLHGFGGQIQNQAVFGKPAEAKPHVTYTYDIKYFDDGSSYELRTPTYTLDNPYQPMGNYFLSPRIAPPVFGLGLLEAIDENDIVAMADEYDANGDGISGKPNYVFNFEAQRMYLGRFGWKANNPTLKQQTAGAYNEDMGITTPYFTRENSFGQLQYISPAKNPETEDSVFKAVTFYVQTLAVPARRNVNDKDIKEGKQLFKTAGCDKCHVSTLRTAVDVTKPYLSNQLIHPYTDLLLHDMGAGLEDNRPDYNASGTEWRTAPLWGIGLTQIVNGHTNFLHDGRARNFTEAIMWHDGEAAQSKNYFKALTKTDRDKLLKFLQSL